MQNGMRPLHETLIIKPRLIICSQGDRKTGKSHLGFLAPQPVGFLNIDRGLDVVHDIALRLGIDYQDYLRANKFSSTETEAYTDLANSKEPLSIICAKMTPELNRLRSVYLTSLKENRTTVVDGFYQMYEIARLSYLGRLLQVMPRDYGPVNNEMRYWFEKARESDNNVIFTNRVADRWVDNKNTGEQEMKGWRDTAYEADMLVEHTCDKTKKGADAFKVSILTCRMNTAANGLWWSGEDVDFASIGMAVFPHSKEGDWR
jgi:hypothetical protein